MVASGHENQGAAADAAQDLGLLHFGAQAEALLFLLDQFDRGLVGLPVSPLLRAVGGGKGDDLPKHAGRHVGGEGQLMGEDAGKRGRCREGTSAEWVEAADCLNRPAKTVGKKRHSGEGTARALPPLPPLA